MSRFVRCIEGHVFDAEAAAQCPVCGAVFEVKPPASMDNLPPPAAAPAAIGAANRSLIVAIVITALGIGLGAGALVYVLRGSAPATIIADSSPAAATEKTKEKSSADSVAPSLSAPSAAPAASNAPASVPSPASTALGPKVAALPETNQTPIAPSQPMSSSAGISDTLRTTLDVARMLVTFNQRDYGSAFAQAEALAGRNNPVGLYMLGGFLEGGLGGTQDLARARASFTAAVNFGEPTAALFLGRMLEGGIGGPPDPEKAKQLYLFAARSMVANAEQELTRLHLDGARGMTALEAYQNLTGQNPNASAISVLNNLNKARSTVAVCLSGWLALQSRARGWVATAGNTDEFVGKTPEEVKRLQAAALTEDQVKAHALQDFELGAVRSDPWCEWGMASLAAEGVSGYPKNQVEAEVFYRLAAMNRRLGPGAEQVKQQMASLESKMSAVEKAQADGLFHGAVPSSVAP